MAIEGKAYMQFGSGDIRVGAATNEDGEVGLVYTNWEAKPIGYTFTEEDLPIGISDVVMTFTDPKSIDVIIQQLECVKNILKEKEVTQ